MLSKAWTRLPPIKHSGEVILDDVEAEGMSNGELGQTTSQLTVDSGCRRRGQRRPRSPSGLDNLAGHIIYTEKIFMELGPP